MILNPRFKLSAWCKKDDAAWQAIKDKITAYCAANAQKQYLDEIALRALDPALAEDNVWAIIKSEVFK